MKKIAHSFSIRNKDLRTPTGLLEKYQQATQELIIKLRERGYEVLFEERSYRNSGVPNSVIVISNNNISPGDIKDRFIEIVRDIRIEKNLGQKLWNFDLGDIYTQEV